MKNLRIINLSLFLFFSQLVFSQTAKGKLFIIGGGNRSEQLLNKLVSISDLRPKDYIVVLPMASEEPDSAFYYFKKQLMIQTKNPIVILNFDTKTVRNKKWIDSLQQSKLIYITGGDQNRFMKVVQNTPVFEAIHLAYQHGSTIAGTSAGAAVMCKKMITGNQKLDPIYKETFDNLKSNNLETADGLGLLKNVIIDQHFIKRSRYNRLISALADYPNLTGVGIDESTAIIISNKTIEVTGESAVIVFKNPKKISKTKNNGFGIASIKMQIFIANQKFKIN